MSKRLKQVSLYVLVTSVFFAIAFFLTNAGKKLQAPDAGNLKPGTNTTPSFIDAITQHLHNPMAILLAQMLAILVVAKFFGYLFKKIGQPSVMGEIVAGIVLGPSLLGLYFPSFSAEMFPAGSLNSLHLVSGLGLILFMFVIGIELDLKLLKNNTGSIFWISYSSILFPFLLGMILAFFTYEAYSAAGVPFFSFALFMGISFSITAFPVLARILQEQNLHKTRLGSLVITCAAANDITGWCLLASVVAIVKSGSALSSMYTIALTIGYLLLMIKVVRPLLKKLSDRHNSRQRLNKTVMASFFLVLILSAYITEVIGIHALFGAFMAGVAMPHQENFKKLVIERLQDITLILLLPLFFVFTGLRTELGLLHDPKAWGMLLVFILVATAGKFLGSAAAAKAVGQTWKDSLSIGALMNTRGLMELIVLNIGYDLGVISPLVFTMMVIMALVTTFMTVPALKLINFFFGNTVDHHEKSGLEKEAIITTQIRQTSNDLHE